MTEERKPGQRVSDPGLLELYASWADELRSKYERVSRLFLHAPSIGRSREVYLAEILRRALAWPLDVRHGAFYTAGHGASTEQDILIIDRSLYPPVEEVGEFGIYFRDSVRACIEVKSGLAKPTDIRDAVAKLAQTKKGGPGLAQYILFAYETSVSADDFLACIENTEDFFDNRPNLVVVLGALVVGITQLDCSKPRPHFTLSAFRPREGSPDLTLMELIHTAMGIKGPPPVSDVNDEIRSHFEEVASRHFVCPVERPGKGAGTNRW